MGVLAAQRVPAEVNLKANKGSVMLTTRRQNADRQHNSALTASRTGANPHELNRLGSREGQFVPR